MDKEQKKPQGKAIKIGRDALPWLVIFAGILFTLYLQLLIPEDVYFSGDAGLKALLSKQLASGVLRFDLVPPPQKWVQNLWNNGLYPFENPFVYNLNNKYWITFPYTFPLVTAPFYALFGYRGFYLVPLIATWAIWLSFYWACRRLKIDNLLTAIGLVVVIFASHLSLYSAMYWEHTLAVALAFQGFSTLLIPGNSQGISKKDAVLSGVLIGLAVWFRPEFLCLVGLGIALVYFASLNQLRQLDFINKRLTLGKLHYLTKNREIFVISMVVTVALFFISNKLIYNHPLGIHAIQVVEEQTLPQRLRDARKNFGQLSWAIFEYLPITFFPVVYLVIAAIAKRRFNIKLAAIYLICFFFIVGVSLIVPVSTQKQIAGGLQWGTRFLLVLVPIISLVAIKELQLIQLKAKPAIKYACFLLFSLLVVIGVHKNVVAGTAFLNKTHEGYLPALQFLQKDPHQVIAMSHQFVAQALEPGLSGNKVFFRVEDSQKLVKLGSALVDQGNQTFIYVCYPHRKCKLPEAKPEALKFSKGNQRFGMKLSKLGKFGQYPIYEGAIAKE
ncbi:MAG TPA: dolichol-phosphate mannosyltransferase [Cyanobacteria bacterium UBA11372]|nr:dolichol-phosphate mannosyltransferase [Cyanobacteria bacterium UBA11372]